MELSPCLRLLASMKGPYQSARLASVLSQTHARFKHMDSDLSGQHAARLSTRSLCQSDSTLRDITRSDNMPIFTSIEPYRNRVAILEQGSEYLYEDIYMRSWDLAKGLLGLNETTWTNQKICIVSGTGLAHVVMTWACWMAGNTAVPLPPSASTDRLAFLIRDSGATVLLATKEFADKISPITKAGGQKLVVLDDSWWKGPEESADKNSPLPAYFVDNSHFKEGNALLVYTAGRVDRPVGFFVSHANLGYQIDRLVDAWDYTSEDSVLHCLPYHQMYGLVNSLHAPLSIGAKVNSLNCFDTAQVWSYLLGVGVTSGKSFKKVTVFPGTPAIYQKLLATGSEIFKDKKTREYVRSTCSKRLRLMTSGTTTLSEQMKQQWRNLTGHKILENYITTEAGTALCNRVAGSQIPGPADADCGSPLAGVEARLVRFRDHTKAHLDVLTEGNEHGTTVHVEKEDEDAPVIGELLLRGRGITLKHCQEGEERDTKLYDGWIATGDILQYRAGCYSVRGRLGIKSIESSSNTFLSAADIEKTIRSSPDILDCYVVGLGDTDNEQMIAAVVVLNKNKKVTLETILDWCNKNLPNQNMIPSVFKMVESIPRCPAGHVDKLQIIQLFSEVPVLCFHDSKF